MIYRYLYGTRRAVLARACLLIAAIALIDWRVDLNISFGFLYLFPILLVGMVSPRWQILATALVCTALSDVFSPLPFTMANSLQHVREVSTYPFASAAACGNIPPGSTPRQWFPFSRQHQPDFLVSGLLPGNRQPELFRGSREAPLLRSRRFPCIELPGSLDLPFILQLFELSGIERQVDIHCACLTAQLFRPPGCN